MDNISLVKSSVLLILLLFISVNSSAQNSRGVELDASSAYVSKENLIIFENRIYL